MVLMILMVMKLLCVMFLERFREGFRVLGFVVLWFCGFVLEFVDKSVGNVDKFVDNVLKMC
jgi:hypothetical protein